LLTALTVLALALPGGPALALPGAAAARGPIVLAPPGNSAVSQYAEVVPTSRGGGMPRPPGDRGGGLTPAQRRSYASEGSDGRALVAVTDATSPGTAALGAAAAAAGANGAGSNGAAANGGVALAAGSRAAASQRGAGANGLASQRSVVLTGTAAQLAALAASEGRALSSNAGQSPGSLILDAATGGGSGGMGIFLPLLLAVTALGAIALVRAVRLRGRDS
jgi:hypothetical protein